MVGFVLAALGIAAGLSLSEPAEGRVLTETAKLSDAIALTRACPSLRIDQNSVAMTLARAGVNLKPIMPEVARQSEAMALRYLTLDRKQACALGRKLYGASGVSAAGFLAER
ncbi:MAG: hypothetical protein Q8Q62_17925 [Mesorhizobium sp.]|nr:hypothetical protein [Mesorhizobium sp.]